MSVDINPPPIQDEIVPGHLAMDVWQKWFSDTFNFFGNYISSSGAVIPSLSTQQRDSLMDVVTGTMIINSDTDSLEVRIGNAWKTITLT